MNPVVARVDGFHAQTKISLKIGHFKIYICRNKRNRDLIQIILQSFIFHGQIAAFVSYKQFSNFILPFRFILTSAKRIVLTLKFSNKNYKILFYLIANEDFLPEVESPALFFPVSVMIKQHIEL